MLTLAWWPFDDRVPCLSPGNRGEFGMSAEGHQAWVSLPI
jgi:hypothetical protein